MEKVDDQTIFWDSSFYPKEVQFVRVNASNPSEVVYYDTNNHHLSSISGNVMLAFPLDSCLFSIGFTIVDANVKAIMQQVLTSRKQKPIAVNANVMSGHKNKKSNVMKQNLWIAESGWRCRNSKDEGNSTWFYNTYY